MGMILTSNFHLQATHAMVPLDATTVDVYRGADAIIFMVDPTKPCVARPRAACCCSPSSAL
jgi:hypothetical protein